MQLWFSRDSDVPIREQLVTQIVLGILCDELPLGQRLPSTRALAKRFGLHPNTISAGYKQLEQEGWLEVRRGSGVYVRDKKPEKTPPPECALDYLIMRMFQSARKLGVSLPDINTRLGQWLRLHPPDHFLVVEPDEFLRQIVIHEMQQALTLAVQGCSPADDSFSEMLSGAVPVVLPSKAEAVRALLPHESDLVTLHVRSIPVSLKEYLPAPAEVLIGIASRWEPFMALAHTMLIAAGFHPDCLILRDAAKNGWQRGLEKASAVLCDSVVASQIKSRVRVICFPLVSDDSLRELQRYQDFIGGRSLRAPL